MRLARLNRDLKREKASDIETKEDIIRATRANITQKMEKPRMYKEWVAHNLGISKLPYMKT